MSEPTDALDTLKKNFTNPSFRFLIGFFVLLAILVTALAAGAPYLLKKLNVISMASPQSNPWGSIGDWYAGVLGISVGFAGTAIAIWLAYRVEALSSHQTRLTQIQIVTDMAKDDGAISRHCEWAAIAGRHVDDIFIAGQRLLSSDLEYGLKLEQLEEETARSQIKEYENLSELLSEYQSRAEIEIDQLWRSIRGLESVLSAAIIHFSSAETHSILKNHLGKLPYNMRPFLEEFIETSASKLETNPRLPRLAQITLHSIERAEAVSGRPSELESEAYLACIRFLVEITVTASKERVSKGFLGKAYHRCDFADQSESIWDALSIWGKEKVGDLFEMDLFSAYLPKTAFFFAPERSATIAFLPPFMSAVLEILNPVRLTDKTLESDDMKVLLKEGGYIPDRLRDIIRSPLTKLATENVSFYGFLARAQPATQGQVSICVVGPSPEEETVIRPRVSLKKTTGSSKSYLR